MKDEPSSPFYGRNGTVFRSNIDRIRPPTALHGAFGPCVAAAKSRSVSITEAKPGAGAVSTALATGVNASQHAVPCGSPPWAATCAALVRSAVASLPTSAHPDSASSSINA